MAIVYSYPTALPESQDLLVGVEMAVQGGEGTPRTKTFTIQSIVDLVETAVQGTPTLQQVTTAGAAITNKISIDTTADPIATESLLLNSAANGIVTVGGFSGIVASGETYGVQCSSANTAVLAFGDNFGLKAFAGTNTGIAGSFSAQSGATADIVEFKKGGIKQAFITPNGSINGNSFVKTGGGATESLMANGTTRNISIFNNSTAPQSITAATVTYLTGSNISIANVKAGSVVNWDIAVLKTAAGVAPPVFTVRFGTTGTTADSTLLTFTGSAQTAIADGGLFSIKCIFKTVGAGSAAVLAGHYTLMHNAQVVGLSVLPVNFSFQTSPGFNSTLANAVLGITVDSGAAAAWTINQVSVKLENQV